MDPDTPKCGPHVHLDDEEELKLLISSSGKLTLVDKLLCKFRREVRKQPDFFPKTYYHESCISENILHHYFRDSC